MDTHTLLGPARERVARRTRPALLVALLAVTLTGLGVGPAAGTAPAAVPADLARAVSADGPGGLFKQLFARRILDTQTGNGAPKAKVGAGASVHLQVTGRGGVPSTGVAAVLLEVTAMTGTAGGSVTVHADDTAAPAVTHVSFDAGRAATNLVLVEVASNGKVALLNRSAGTTNLLADVVGYYTSGTTSAPGAVQTVDPTRVLSTVTGQGAPASAVAPGATVHLPVAGVGGVPSAGASGVVLSVTVSSPSRGGGLTVHPDGTTAPATWNLRFLAGQTVSNHVVVPLGSNGAVAFKNSSTGTVHVTADVSGYVLSGAAASPGAYTAVTPRTVVDTRSGLGAPAARIPSRGTLRFQATGRNGVPSSGVSAVVVDLRTHLPAAAGYLTAYGDGFARPVALNLRFAQNEVATNLAVVPVGPGGKVAVYNGAAGSTHVVVDVFGYIKAPPTVGTVCTNPWWTTSSAGEGLTTEGYYVHNQLWNAASYPGTKGTTSVCSYHSWNHVAVASNSSGDGAVKTYPNVHKDYYDNPRKISSFTRLTSRFAARAPAVGIYNVAYDLWITGPSETEVMIWTENRGQTPAGSRVATGIVVDGRTWDLYAERDNGYIAFVAPNGTRYTSGTLDLKVMLAYLVSKGRLTTSHTIEQICYGVEIVSTDGKAATWNFTDFNITDS